MSPTDLTERIRRASLPPAHTFLDGDLCDAPGPAFQTCYPGDGTPIAQVASADDDLVDRAVRGAAAAGPAWAATPPARRAAILRDAADVLEASIDRLAHLVVLDNGKTYVEARADVVVAAALLRASAAWATTLEGTTLPADATRLTITIREPVGVVAAVIPFNAPLMFCAQKAGPALAAGNTVVIKAPEQSPLAAPAFAQVLDQAGLPSGVLQVIQGDAVTGRLLLAHEQVDLISFTGSTVVGRQVMAAAAAGLKRLLLELGGKSANIVYDDADLDAATDGTLAGIFRNAGQRCFSGSRLLVQETVADAFIERLVRKATAIPVGDPFDPINRIGALISTAEVARVRRMLDDAQAAGGRRLVGGEHPAGAHPDGAYLTPAIVEIPASCGDAALVRDEVFGPVLAVQRFKDTDEAIAMANDSAFGLAGGCWTRDLDRALRTARGVRTGYFWINSYGALGLDAPVGGYKASGFGRELGRQGHEAYTELKTVIVETAPERTPAWF